MAVVKLSLALPSPMLFLGLVVLQAQQDGRKAKRNVHGVVVPSLSLVWLGVTLQTAVCQASLSFTVSRTLLRLMSIESVMPSNHLILCRPLLLLPSIFPSIKVFSNESPLGIRWPNYWSFSISPSIEYSGLISFRIGWFDLLQPTS